MATTIEKMSIALPPEMVAQVRQAVATGEYASSSEVVRDALRDWSQKRQIQQQGLNELRALWLEARANDRPGVPVDGVLDRLERKYRDIAAGGRAGQVNAAGTLALRRARSRRHRGLDRAGQSTKSGDVPGADSGEIRRIGAGPLLYQLRPDIGVDARLAVVGRYVILFRIAGEVVRIERVIYGGRDLPGVM